MGVGMPGCLLLHEFGEHVLKGFGHIAYHVGSSLTSKTGWRDVDVRVLIPDEEYVALYGDPEHPHYSPRWVSTILAWSCFGKHLTDLPIDFQIQAITQANKEFTGPRSALFNVNNRRSTHTNPSAMDEDKPHE